ncbi:hypothetical protein ACS5PN_17235 [Roseateles sp. NT4]|uniref:hypothetical protein n=1 Tax=Roseateles sp. NT4 TaxID=3453715 RepID=UPI003EE8507E
MIKRGEGVILNLGIQQLESGFYEFHVEFAGQLVESAAGFSSISEAIESAAGVTGDIRGFQISYGGLVIGTYPLETLRADAGAVAHRAVETAAAFQDD